MPQYLLAMTIFGTIGLFVKFIDLPSTVIALSRGALGTIFLLIALQFMKQKMDTESIKRNFKHLFIAAVALGFNWIFLFEAYRLTSIATATLAYYMVPVILILLSPLILKEHVSLTKWLCVICALIGMTLIAGVWEGSDHIAFGGIAMGLLAACFYATIVVNNKFLKDINPYDSAIVQLGIAALVLLPYVAFTVDLATLTFDAQTIGLTLIVGVVHTGVAYWLYFSALPKLEAARIAIFSYIDPAIAILLSVFVLMEPMTTHAMIGAVLILGAALTSEFIGKKTE